MTKPSAKPGGIRLRLFASLVALGAGAAAVTVALLLLRDVLA
jgi:hypothetical protein